MTILRDGISKLTPDVTTNNPITNFLVKITEDETFELILVRATKVSGNDVLEAENIGNWKFNSLDHLKRIVEKVEQSVIKQREKRTR
jgi:hypothetical protein